MIKPEELFELDKYSHKKLFDVEYVWEGLKDLKGYINETINPNVDSLLENGDVLPRTVILHKDKVRQKIN